MMWTMDKVQEMYKEKSDMSFLFFWGHQKSKDGYITKSCLSQWWKCQFSDGENEYTSTEQYMMSEKAKLFGDLELQARIITSEDPKEIKHLGRQIKNFEQATWDAKKREIVTKGNYLKFTQDNELRHYLLATGNDLLVEASPVDDIWGVGLAENDPTITNPLLWRGENLLGFALMDVREQILSEAGS